MAIVETSLPSNTFVTTARMTADAARLLAAAPPDLAAVVGMARSGLLPGSLLACALHLPFYAASGETVLPAINGQRLGRCGLGPGPVLLVDDTVCSGRSIRQVEPWVRMAFPGRRIIRAAVYTTARGREFLDLAAVELPGPHYLEWNYFNSTLIHRAWTDMDGILCRDIAAADDDDGPRYARALETAAPLHLPRREPVGAIVTARLEKYRAITVAWLARWGVRYKELIMGPWPNNAARSRPGAISAWKAEVIGRCRPPLFIESDPRQAREIHGASGATVMCPALEQVLTANN